MTKTSMQASPDSRTILAELLANPKSTQKYFRDVQRLIGSVLLDNALRIDRIERKMDNGAAHETKWRVWFINSVLPTLITWIIAGIAFFVWSVFYHVDIASGLIK